MRSTQLLGVFMWRAGLMLAGSYSAYRIARIGLRYVELPAQIEVGAGLVLAGCLLVGASLVLERIRDARDEAPEA